MRTHGYRNRCAETPSAEPTVLDAHTKYGGMTARALPATGKTSAKKLQIVSTNMIAVRNHGTSNHNHHKHNPSREESDSYTQTG